MIHHITGSVPGAESQFLFGSVQLFHALPVLVSLAYVCKPCARDS